MINLIRNKGNSMKTNLISRILIISFIVSTTTAYSLDYFKKIGGQAIASPKAITTVKEQLAPLAYNSKIAVNTLNQLLDSIDKSTTEITRITNTEQLITLIISAAVDIISEQELLITTIAALSDIAVKVGTDVAPVLDKTKEVQTLKETNDKIVLMKQNTLPALSRIKKLLPTLEPILVELAHDAATIPQQIKSSVTPGAANLQREIDIIDNLRALSANTSKVSAHSQPIIQAVDTFKKSVDTLTHAPTVTDALSAFNNALTSIQIAQQDLRQLLPDLIDTVDTLSKICDFFGNEPAKRDFIETKNGLIALQTRLSSVSPKFAAVTERLKEPSEKIKANILKLRNMLEAVELRSKL
jgi:hypothetical protein